MHRQTADMMKKMGKGGMKGLMGALGGGLPDMGGSMPNALPKDAGLPDFEQLQKQFGGKDGPKLDGLGNLPGLGQPPKKK